MVEGAGQSADKEELIIEKEAEEEEIALKRRRKSRSSQQAPIVSSQPAAVPSAADDEQNQRLAIQEPPKTSLAVQNPQEESPGYFLKFHFANTLHDSLKNELQDQAWKIANRDDIIHKDSFRISQNVQGLDVGCEVKYQDQNVEFSLLSKTMQSQDIFQRTVISYLEAAKIMKKEVEFELIVDDLNEVESMLKGLDPEIINKIAKFTLRRGSEFTPISKDFVESVKDKLTAERQSTSQPPRQRL